MACCSCQSAATSLAAPSPSSSWKMLVRLDKQELPSAMLQLWGTTQEFQSEVFECERVEKEMFWISWSESSENQTKTKERLSHTIAKAEILFPSSVRKSLIAQIVSTGSARFTSAKTTPLCSQIQIYNDLLSESMYDCLANHIRTSEDPMHPLLSRDFEGFIRQT